MGSSDSTVITVQWEGYLRMVVPNWKSILLMDWRKCGIKLLNDDLSLLLLEACTSEFKESIMKIKVDVSYEVNAKNLNT